MKSVRLTLRSTDTPAQRADAIMALLDYDGAPHEIAYIRDAIAITLQHYAEIDAEARA